MRGTSSFWLNILAGMALAAAAIIPARAQDPDDLKRGVARISLINGEVSVQRGDSGEFVAASVNAPLLTNDRISTAPNSRAEVQFDSGNILRIGGDAEVSFSQIESGRYQMAVGRGTVTYRLLRSSNLDVEVDTPNVSVRPSKQGSYRIAVSPDGESEITARSGDVEVFTPRGSQWVNAGQAMMARGTASDPEFQMVRARAYDEWDRWSDGRDRAFTAATSPQYVPPGVYGAEDLDPYGNWVNVPSYGNVWQPTVAADWAPYRSGRWVWEDWYGWTWVSYDPWGWAPYHYGRWFNEPGYGWCWYPGAIGVRHYWSPALVAFFGFGGGGFGVGFGNVGWVPLAPYEVLHPWWGRGYYGGGFNRSVNITNVNITNTYRNSRFRNGFTAVSGTDFRSGRFNNLVRPSGEDLRQASFARGPIPLAPERANLRFSDRQAAFVPQAGGNSRVFSYRQPTPVERVPFAEQQRRMGATPGVQPNRAQGFGAAPEVRQPVGSRFGVPAAQNAVPQAGNPGVRNEFGGGQRFGGSQGPQVAPRAEQQTPQSARGWNRFGDPAAAGPRPDYRQSQPQSQPQQFRNEAQPVAPRYQPYGGNRSGSLQIAPPVVRERPNGGAPYGGGGGYNAPPRNEMRAPSGGFGGGRAPSGGGFSGGSRAPSGGGGGNGSRGGGGNGGGGHRGH